MGFRAQGYMTIPFSLAGFSLVGTLVVHRLGGNPLLTAIPALALLGSTAIVSRRSLYMLYVQALLLTEFFYIEFISGVLRPYHLLTVPVFLLLCPYWTRLFRSRVFLAVLFFHFFVLLSCVFSVDPKAALTGYGLLFANTLIALTIGLMLGENALKIGDFIKGVVFASVLSVAWAVKSQNCCKFGSGYRFTATASG